MLTKVYNYLIKVEYDGTKFVGWQYQKNGKSVQEKLEKILKKLLKDKIKVIGAGRTDKGVHASGQYANFKTIVNIRNNNKFLNSANHFLKKDLISIININKKKIDSTLIQYEELIVMELLIRVKFFHLIIIKLDMLKKT